MEKKMINKITVAILIVLSSFCLSANDIKCEEAKQPTKLFEKCKDVKINYANWAKKESFCQEKEVCKSIKLEAAKLEKEIRTKDGEIAKLKEQIKAKDSEISSLKKSAGKDVSKFETLEKEIQTKDGEIAKLKEQITKKESEIARLKSDAGKAKRDSNGEISERNSQIETLKGEKQKLQSDLGIAQDTITDLETENKTLKEKPTGVDTKWIFVTLIFGFLLGCAVLVFVYTKLQPKKHKSEENEESRYNSSDVIAEKVAGKLAQTFSNLKMTINSLPKQTSEQTVTQLMPIIRQQIEKSNIANATTHHTEAVSIPAEPVIKTYYARMVGERFESSGERSAWFILKDDGNTITFDLVDSYKKDRRNMNEAFKVLSQCFENYDSSDSNAVLITSPGKARRDDEEHWRVLDKGRIIR